MFGQIQREQVILMTQVQNSAKRYAPSGEETSHLDIMRFELNGLES